MKVYLDNSSLNRPFDDQSQLKIHLEAEAVLSILKLVENNAVKLVNSDVIEYENSKNPFFERKRWVSEYISKADYYQKVNEEIKEKAKTKEEKGISAMDALHLSSAEASKVDCFITCDQEIIKKYKGKLEAINPVDFVQRI